MSDQGQTFDGDNGEWEFPSAKELGPLLKAKREEMGLGYAEISSQIKVSARYLEALENEAWDRLPSPTFVRGFIRSYARVLGLSADGLVALYRESAPPPQPLTRKIQAGQPKKMGLLLYLVLLVAVLAAGIAAYHWIAHSDEKGKPTPPESVPSEEGRPNSTGKDPSGRSDREETPPADVRQPFGPNKDTDGGIPREISSSVPASKPTGPAEPSVAAPPQAKNGAVPVKTEPLSEPGRSIPDGGEASESDLPPLVLKATVRERTWVRVIIDGQKSKESIFSPESHPEWRAYKGFELLIGNAGGIDLEFDGQKLGPLGKPGQVIRMRLPSIDERSVPRD